MSHSFTTILFIAFLVGFPKDGSAQVDSDAAVPRVKHLIDTHIHLYDTDRAVYDIDADQRVPWPPSDDQVLHKPHLPKEYSSVARAAGVTGVVIVEASPRIDDNRWVLDRVADDQFYVGLVGNIDPFGRGFAEDLEQYRSDPRFVGIRGHFMKNRNGFSSDPQLLANLRVLSDAGLALDVLMNGEGADTIDELTDIAKKNPSLRIIVNHVLGYDIDGKNPGQSWITAVRRLAAQPNVSIKVSGLYQRSKTQPAPQDIAFYRGILDVLWNAYGSERLIYGSNWPVTKKSGDYASFVKLVTEYFNDKGQDAKENFFWRNASIAYQLGLD